MQIPSRRKAFALVLVLIVIVLTTTMAVFFLDSAARERRGVDLYASGAQVRHLAGMSVNRVMAQINQATKEGTATTPVSWASQPGMIRTFGATGDPSNVYKLYSWDNPIEPGAGFIPTAAAQVPPANWNTNTALFTDLNQPMNDVYPIVDPRAADPSAAFQVEGFSINPNPAVSSSSPAPMPVKWLYILEDGRMVAPSGGTGTTATFSAPNAPTAGNPIVGRVGFWTDDETCKVNVNTAAEGAYWDWPKAATYNEMQFAGNPPVSGEYNRTPGHPAMTSLSAVFPELAPGDRWSGSLANYRNRTRDILGLTPRVPYSTASSQGGTYPIEAANFNYGPTGTLPTIPSAALPAKTDRLFVSPDELFFTTTMNASARDRSAIVTTDMLQKRSFFLTSSSRAPETTLFETPRISLWPITWPYASAHASLPNRQTAAVSSPNPDIAALSTNPWMRAEERLLAFVSTLNKQRSDGGDKYFFQRQNPESPTHDYANIRRNRELLAYLQRLTSSNLPGFAGGSFSSKYTPQTRDAILANSFNVVRSLVNQYTLDPSSAPADFGKMLYSYTPVAFRRLKRPSGIVQPVAETNAFSPLPMKLNLGSGDIVTVSEFPLLREAGLVFYATQRVDPIAPPDDSGLPAKERHKIRSNPWNWQNLINLDPSDAYPDGARTTQMRAVLLLDFAPLRGVSRNNQPVFWVKLTGGTLTAESQNLGFGNAVAQMDFRAVDSGRRLPPYLLPLFEKNASGSPAAIKSFNNGNVSSTNYGLISSPVTLPATATQFQFTGGPLNIEIYGIKNGDPALDPTSDANLLVASYRVDFSVWDGSHGIPLAPRWNYYEIADQTPQRFPNPRFDVFDISRPTRWAAMEIAPGYRTGASGSDPANIPTDNASIWGLNILYPTLTDGPSNVTGGSISPIPGNSTFGKTVTYAKRDTSGELMTDYAKRLKFIHNIGSVAAPVTVGSTSENGGRVLNNATEYVYTGGFPAITAYDTVLSLLADPVGPGNGDPRLAQNFRFIRSDNAVGAGVPLRQVMPLADYPRINRQFHTLGTADQKPPATGYITRGAYGLIGKGLAPSGMAVIGASSSNGTLGRSGTTITDDDAVGVTSAIPQASIGNSASVGDWTSQAGFNPDGGAIARPDQDFQALVAPGGAGTGLSFQTPYFRVTDSLSDGVETAASAGYFSPNRQIPSPIGLLGGLPTSQTVGWQTLVFSPNPARGATHPGLLNLPDHLLLDLFWMPVVEPYPISEEFSTAGKINLNSEIVPFNYIKRQTGLHALLKSTWITALNNSLAASYKSHDAVRGLANSQTRYSMNATETLKRFDSDVFSSGNIFRSASQICSMWLVPQGSTAATVETFWNDKLLTSDTAREEPYNNLYSRVTTKSNTYTVHWRVQTLRKVPGTAADLWDESKDRVAAELRGSTLIERFLDPNATNIPDYATDASALTLSHFYKWRVVSENYFQP